MANHNDTRMIDRSAHMVVLTIFTLLAGALMAHILIMGWEIGFIPLMLACVIAGWTIHIRQFFTDSQRIWINAMFCLAGFFFYGSHTSSMFDMVGITLILLLSFTVAGEPNLNALTLLAYYVTLLFDIIQLNFQDYPWDLQLLSRVILHSSVVLICGRLANTITKQWTQLLHGADSEIKKLNETTRMMDVFLANLSHELRTPVNMILGSASVVKERAQDPELRSSLNGIYDAGRRVKSQVEDILDFAEVEMGSLTVNTEIYMLSSLLNDLAVNLRPMIPPNLELVLDMDPDIPAALRSDPIKLRRILYHLIRNGLQYTREGGVYVHLACVRREYGVNLCVEVTDTGVGMTEEETALVTTGFYKARSGDVRSGGLGVGLAVVAGFVSVLGGFMSIESKPDRGTTVRFSIPQEVTDEGRSMTVSHPDRVRAIFFYDTTALDLRVREFYNAMYIDIMRGLRIPLQSVESADKLERAVKKFAPTHIIVEKAQYEANRERIEELAKQCVVALLVNGSYTLPPNSRVRVVEKPFFCYPLFGVLELSPDDSLIEDDRILVCKDVHALVVDDEPMNIKVASSILRRHGMTVDKAGSGAEAVKICGEKAFDVIFMDHMMPGMDGVEAMKRIREDLYWREHPCPFVILTANTLSTAREMFEREGFDAFVAKPIDRVELERALKHVLPSSKYTYEKPDQAPTASAVATASGNPATAAAQPEAAAAPAATPAPAPSGAAAPQPVANGMGGKWSRVESVGIDVHMGLQYSMNDEDFYISVLQDYAQDAAAKREKMEGFFTSGDCANYAILVHALKSTSLMIGAADLSARAKALEAAAKGGDKPYIDAHHRETMELYAAVSGAILETVSPGAATQPAGGGDSDGDVLDFTPGGGDAGGDVLDFAPGGDVMDFAPGGGDVLDFAPSGGGDVLDFAPGGSGGPSGASFGFTPRGGAAGGSFDFASGGNDGGGSFDFAPEGGDGGDTLSFAPSGGSGSSDTMDFAPSGGGDAMEFSPDGELMDFAPNDDLIEFMPEEG